MLPRLLAAANIFVLKWELDEYVSNPLKHQEFTIYINHNLRLMNWISENTEQLQKLIAAACSLEDTNRSDKQRFNHCSG